MPILNHVHKYERARWDREIYRCLDPDCMFETHKDKIFGKRAVCAMCSNEFILDGEALRRKIPNCLNCRHSKKTARLEHIGAISDAFFSEVEK